MFAEGLFEQNMKTIEEKAKAHAGKAMIECKQSDVPFDVTQSAALGMYCRDAYLAGATEALAAQWRSVVVELPEEHDEVLVSFSPTYAPNNIEQAVAYYDGEDWYTTDGTHIRPSHWLPIPELPKI